MNNQSLHKEDMKKGACNESKLKNIAVVYVELNQGCRNLETGLIQCKIGFI